jgi:hypothetical protein
VEPVPEDPLGEPPAEVREELETAPRPYGFRQIAEDARYLSTRPFRLDRRGAVKLSAAAGTAGVLFLFRNRIRDAAQEHRTEDRDRILDGARTMGKGGIAPAVAGIAWLVSLATRNEREKETAVMVLESMGFTALGVGIGQTVLASERPIEGNGIDYFRRGGHGFSGDAGLAASIVAPLRCQYLTVDGDDTGGVRFWKRTAVGLLYAGAALTAAQRVNKDRHWAPDAFLGTATGLAVGGALCDAHEKFRAGRMRVRVTPGPGGLAVRWDHTPR